MANVDKMQLQVRHKLLKLQLNFPRLKQQQKLQQQRLCNLQLQLAAIVWPAVCPPVRQPVRSHSHSHCQLSAVFLPLLSKLGDRKNILTNEPK